MATISQTTFSDEFLINIIMSWNLEGLAFVSFEANQSMAFLKLIFSIKKSLSPQKSIVNTLHKKVLVSH